MKKINRVIKFRGKDSKTCEWRYGFVVTFNDKNKERNKKLKTMIYVYELDKYFEVIPESVGQFTGVKDKNGQEICEGDIVDLPVQSKPEGGSFSNLVVVKYEKFGFVPFIDFENWTDDETKIIEVIGNIFENLELMEVKG